jgi:predicted metalloendopeptidase
MDAATQEEAMSKADNMLQLIGYPDWLPEEAELDAYYEGAKDADAADHFGNVVSMLAWSVASELSTLRKVPERDIWLMHPAIVNAWYSPNHNTITFPAGILQAPFFQGGWPRYLNYGAIGMVIGHEITHGFDDQGRQYDGSGNLAPWWTEETLQAFTARAQCFIDQYGNYTVPEIVDIIGEEDAHLDGTNTQGENIADNGGIHESFRAYMKSIETMGEEPALPGLEQFTPQQMFFISFSQVWCELQTPQSLLGQVLGDPHSPGKFRVIGPVSNSEDFQREFNCPEGSPMVRPEKCKLW